VGKVIDLIGQKFGRLTVIERAPDHITPSGHKEVMWVCKCECGGIKIARGTKLRSGDVRSCGCLQKEIQEERALNLIGQKFGRLTVIKRVENNINKKGEQRSAWLCACECGKCIVVTGDKLKTGNTKSCGCLQKDVARKNMMTTRTKTDYTQIGLERRTINKYDLSGEYGIGYTSNCNEEGINYFYFDLEDYDKIKDYHWHFQNGYIAAKDFHKNYNTCVKLHRLIMNPPPEKEVDHIYHKQYDNRKSELRIVNGTQNRWNVKGKRDLSSKKYRGVQKRGQKYRVSINYNKQRIYIGNYDTFEEAVEARQQAEEKYYGEYRYQEAE